jgi:predicted dehydrogenase
MRPGHRPGHSPPRRVGIIGCGNVTLNDHVPAFLALVDLFRVVAVADPSEERRMMVGDRLGLSAADRHVSADELLARPDIEVVDICTPPYLHRAFVESAAASGRHILCEKPLATSPRDAEAITAAVERAGVRFSMVHNYLWFPEVIALRRLIREGAIGAVRVVLIDSLGIDDNPGAAGYRPGWRHEVDAGGGILMDLIHLVYLAEAMLGQPIERVSASVMAEPGASVESLALCRFEAGEAMALVNVGWGAGPGGLRVSGTGGRVEVRYRGGATGPFIPIDMATVTPIGGASRPLGLDGRRDITRAAIEDFGSTLVDGRPPTADARSGARAVAATVAAYESAATGATVVLPLDEADPVHAMGVAGLADMVLPDWSPVRRLGLFGVQP